MLNQEADFFFVIPVPPPLRDRLQPESREAGMNKQFAVYILASKKNGTLYIGVTSTLVKRIWEHKNNLVEGFTKRYNVHLLVWYELHENIESAYERKTIERMEEKMETRID